VRAANTAPSTAAPSAPPSARKKPAVAVATPSSRRSTLFCTAVISTCVTMPKPSPNPSSPALAATRDGVQPELTASHPSAPLISASPATGKRL